MQFIFSTGSLYTYGTDRCFALAAQAGFDGIEVMIDYRWDTRQQPYLQGLIDRFQQPVLAVHSPFVAHVPGWPADAPGRIKKSVRLAERLGARVVIHHLPERRGWRWIKLGGNRWPVPTLSGEPAASYQRWLEEDYADVQTGTDVKLCIENMPARQWLGRRWNGHRWNSPAEIGRFPALTLDTTHLGTWGLAPEQVYQQLVDRVAHVHLSNFDGREHRRPEDGHLALDRLLARMAENGYGGLISLELHPDALAAGEPDEQIVERLAASLSLCRRWARGD